MSLPNNTATPVLTFPKNYNGLITLSDLILNELRDLNNLGKDYVDTFHREILIDAGVKK